MNPKPEARGSRLILPRIDRSARFRKPVESFSPMTNAAVLVLNRHYQPIRVTSAKRAFTLLYLGVARVIDQQFRTFDFESWAQLSAEIGDGAAGGNDFVRTVNRAILVPRVII